MALVNNNVGIVGYNDRALEGDHITFTCPSGLVLNGSNSSMCVGNGEWEPDPREVNCISELYMTTVAGMYCKYQNYAPNSFCTEHVNISMIEMIKYLTRKQVLLLHILFSTCPQ